MCEQSEEERMRDQKEREELEQHIRERDTAGTRKVIIYIHIFKRSYINMFK